jgi:hypothetical protein
MEPERTLGKAVELEGQLLDDAIALAGVVPGQEHREIVAARKYGVPSSRDFAPRLFVRKCRIINIERPRQTQS